MTKKIIDMSFLNDLFDALGLTAVISAMTLNLTAWLLGSTWNTLLVLVTSVAGIIYLLLKCYDVMLSIKQRQRDLKE